MEPSSRTLNRRRLLQGAAAQVLAPQVGLPLPVVEVWQRRARYGVKPIDAAVVASQQSVADVFFQQHLIPKKIDIARAVWRWSRAQP